MPESHYKDEKFLKKFGANLKKVRKNQGISQEELANDLEFSQPYIAKLEAGKVNCSISHVVAIVRRLKIPISDLMDIKQ